MYYTKQQLFQIQKESRLISRNFGLMFSRTVVLCCLFLLFFSLRPTSIYLFAAFAFFPCILAEVLSNKPKYKKEPILFFCAKKYLFTYHHYIAEKYTGNIILFSLVIWQLFLIKHPVNPILLRNAPILCLLLYLCCRILSTEIAKRKIRHFYEEFELLC